MVLYPNFPELPHAGGGDPAPYKMLTLGAKIPGALLL